jgi:hypothetical protein
MSLRIHHTRAARALAALALSCSLAGAFAAQPATIGKPVALEGTLDVLV